MAIVCIFNILHLNLLISETDPLIIAPYENNITHFQMQFAKFALMYMTVKKCCIVRDSVEQGSG